MKRSHYLFPLMAMTALSLSLAACDDKKDETTAQDTTAAAPADATATPDTAAAMTPAAVIHVEGATAYATAEGATTGAVFLTLHNPQAVADKLIGVTDSLGVPAALHETTTGADGTMAMNPVTSIEIPAGQQINLKPDGYHIMLTGLTAPLKEGVPFDITLDFETAGDVTIPVTVTAPAAGTTPAPAETMDHSTMAPAESTTTTPTADESPAPADSTTTAPAEDPAATTPTTDAPAADVPAAQ